jgi:hypothetical protein
MLQQSLTLFHFQLLFSAINSHNLLNLIHTLIKKMFKSLIVLYFVINIANVFSSSRFPAVKSSPSSSSSSSSSSSYDHSLPSPAHKISLHHSTLHHRSHGHRELSATNGVELTPLYPGKMK